MNTNPRDSSSAAAATNATGPETILARLRRETREAHEHAEALVGLPRSLDAHAKTLAAFFGFLEPWEQTLTPWLPALAPRLGDRGKARLLIDDLAALGWSSCAIANLPRCQSLPRVASLHRALGSMYVFEGATLGGTIIARHLETLGFREGIGYSFYRSYGPRVGPMWREFGQVLLDATCSEMAADETVFGARETFDALSRWLGAIPR